MLFYQQAANASLFTCTWSWTTEPDGTTDGWAIYPNN